MYLKHIDLENIINSGHVDRDDRSGILKVVKFCEILSSKNGTIVHI